jgi:hypothetical protein
MIDFIGPDLSDAEVDRICDGLMQSAAKCRYLRSLGLTVDRKPNGRPLVNRRHYDAVRGGGELAQASSQDASAIQWSVR